jgi:hypothetical protein
VPFQLVLLLLLLHVCSQVLLEHGRLKHACRRRPHGHVGRNLAQCELFCCLARLDLL